MIGRPMILYGASLGGAVAVDFALEHPEVCLKLFGNNFQRASMSETRRRLC